MEMKTDYTKFDEHMEKMQTTIQKHLKLAE
jgi:hypothetical protein